jgi:hypothetical protein
MLGALAKRLGHAFLDGLAHAGHGQQKQRFLDLLPILGRNKNRAPALARNVDRLMELSRLIDEAVQLGPRLAGSEGRHR